MRVRSFSESRPPEKNISKRNLYFHTDGLMSFDPPPAGADDASDSYVSDPAAAQAQLFAHEPYEPHGPPGPPDAAPVAFREMRQRQRAYRDPAQGGAGVARLREADHQGEDGCSKIERAGEVDVHFLAAFRLEQEIDGNDRQNSHRQIKPEDRLPA